MSVPWFGGLGGLPEVLRVVRGFSSPMGPDQVGTTQRRLKITVGGKSLEDPLPDQRKERPSTRLNNTNT